MPEEAGAHIYVIGEAEDRRSPVKIGLHYGPSRGLVRSGLQTGNWRTLEVLGSWPLPPPTARWHEFVIHHNLKLYKVRGEWFKVRHLLDTPDGWLHLLKRAFKGDTRGAEPMAVGRRPHQLVRIDMPEWLPPNRVVEAHCTCGEVITCTNTTLPAAYKHFMRTHAVL